MTAGLTVRIVGQDDDYLGIEIQASNGRFVGSVRICAWLRELSDFAARIAGFPAGQAQLLHRIAAHYMVLLQ